MYSVCDHSPPTLQTDRQTTFLYYTHVRASRDKKPMYFVYYCPCSSVRITNYVYVNRKGVLIKQTSKASD